MIRVLLDRGVTTGKYEDFMTGFVVNDVWVWARPVGALLVSDDANGAIWRASYVGG